ncbi:MAG TPA: SAM-dependent methyltransferase [Micromonosporaceae bacterium]|nr:SAM-dependent methyltransferase [Micromonosporaceae bacterium]
MVLDGANPRSVSAKARGRRWAELMRRFPELDQMKVLDLGGRPQFWRDAPVRPAAVTTVNLVELPADEPWITTLIADACADRWTHGTFDLVISNSLLEHLGGVARRKQFADVVHAASERWWIQTPYRYFPIEPHWFFPGFQFLPLPMRIAITRRWPLGYRHAKTREQAYELVQEVELVTITEMRTLFPEGDVWKERMAGLVKSLVAVRT